MKIKERNIRYNKQRNNFIVDLTHQGKRVTRSFADLEKAKKFRNELVFKVTNDIPLEVKPPNREGIIGLSHMIDKVTQERWSHSKSLGFYEVNTKALLDFFGDVGLETIKTENIHNFVNACRDKGNSPATINRKLTVLRTLVTEAAKAYPTVAKELPVIPQGFKESEGRVRILTDKEERTMLEILKADDHRAYCGAVILLDTGLRESELVRLKAREIDFTLESLTVVDSKNSTTRTIPMTERTKECLKAVLKSGTWFRKGFLHKAWNKARKTMGLEHDPEFIPYCLRHTCATRLVSGHGERKPMPQALVQYWMGHRRGETTERYIHVNPRQLKAYL